MTVAPSRPTTTAPSIPRPRDAEPELPQADERTTGTPAAPPAQFPWPEPWRYALGARPRTEYWDVATASWHSRGPRPRTSD
jgi:hypothetical protein